MLDKASLMSSSPKLCKTLHKVGNVYHRTFRLDLHYKRCNSRTCVYDSSLCCSFLLCLFLLKLFPLLGVVFLPNTPAASPLSPEASVSLESVPSLVPKTYSIYPNYVHHHLITSVHCYLLIYFSLWHRGNTQFMLAYLSKLGSFQE